MILFVCGAGCGKHASEEAAPAVPPLAAAPDTVALAVGDYHGIYSWSEWSMGSGSSSGSYEIDFAVTADSTRHNGVNVRDEQHVRILPNLYLDLMGMYCGGRVVLNDSIFTWRSYFSPGLQSSHSIAGKKIH